jgi:hypothetical protein
LENSRNKKTFTESRKRLFGKSLAISFPRGSETVLTRRTRQSRKLLPFTLHILTQVSRFVKRKKGDFSGFRKEFLWLFFKFGFVGGFKFAFVGAGVLDGPPTFPEKFVVG